MGLQDNIELHRESKVNNGHGNADRHVILSELQLPSHETVRNARIMDDGGIASAAAVEAEKATATADGDKSEEEGEGEEDGEEKGEAGYGRRRDGELGFSGVGMGRSS